MFYKKLMQIYQETDCHNYFSKNYVEALSDYILAVEKDTRLKYLNPFEFSKRNCLSLQETLRFFMYFTDQKSGPIRILPFVECFTDSCSERLFFGEAQEEEFIICQECGKDYELNEVNSFMKVYFQYQNHEYPEIENLTDRNSPYEILNGFDQISKLESPSSKEQLEGEGDPSVEFDKLVDNNIKPNGQPITDAVPSPTHRLMDELSSRRSR